MKLRINHIYGADMSQRILIDMVKLREAMSDKPDLKLPEAFFLLHPINSGLKTVIELATFRFTCRKCQDAPCISACPAEALEKDEEGLVTRHTNLCISCKSCLAICPFGTMMSNFFRHHRNRDLFCDLSDTAEMEKFAAACPPGTVRITNETESPNENIVKLNEKVLIRDFIYQPGIK
jgi:Fe-S-cluster-containing dehydrogenase component